jgi:hypothetical protein
VPPQDIRRLRTRTRYRRKLVQARTAEKERCEKLEDAHLKLSSVISDIHGLSGATLGETAASAGRTQTFPGAKLRRLCRHMPGKKAQAVIMRSQIVIAHALLSDPEASYQDLGPGYYEQRAGARRRTSGL